MSTDTLASALVAAQAEMPKVPKNGTNPHFRSSYATLDDLIDTVRPVLEKHQLAFSQLPCSVDGALGLETVLLHGPSGERLASVMPLLLQKSDMQGAGSALTYGRRYALAAMLGIAEGTDDDGNHAARPPVVQQAAATDVTFTAPPAAQTNTISEAQVKKLWASWREKAGGRSDEVLKTIVQTITGQDSTKAIPKDKFNAVLAALDDSDIPF